MHRRALHADARQLVRDPLGRAADLRGPRGVGADALDPQELVELRQVLGIVLAQVGDGGIGGCRGIRMLGCHDGQW